MKEDFLHHLWKFRNLSSQFQYTSTGQRIEIIHPGIHNHDAGPDFFNARIRIDDLEWAGNVEIHVKSSDWVLHGHSSDRAYDSVILHVVYEDDKPLKLSDSPIPTLQLKGCVDISSLEKYKALSVSDSFVPCSSILKQHKPNKVLINNYLDRLYVEKLEYKSNVILDLLRANQGDWEETYYQLVARSFGRGKNRVPFELLAKSAPLEILREEGADIERIEALLLGQAGFLNDAPKDAYSAMLSNIYLSLQFQYNLQPIDEHLWKFLRLRPGNFPTLRIAQLARLFSDRSIGFKSLFKIKDVGALFKLFSIEASDYWANHSKFGRASSQRSTRLGRDSVKGILINAIVPMLFEYGREYKQPSVKNLALGLMSQLSSETNNIISRWKELGFSIESAAQSQALLHLKTAYCNHKKCLSCAIGTAILNKST